MERFRLSHDREGKPVLDVPCHGPDLLRHPMYNKGTAFTREEQASFGLEGLLPDAVSSMEQQARRARANILRKHDPLYTAAAGIHPAQTLPVSLDVGTDKPRLLEDDLYLGWRHRRLRGEEYDALVDEFVQAVRTRFPKAVLQWEDFKKGNAFRLLDRYRRVLPSFNDDIQGTAAVTLAAILAAERITGTPLARERIVILGAGAAGIGIAQLLRDALRRTGVEGEDLLRALAVLDSQGLLVDDVEIRDGYKREFAWSADLAAEAGLGSGRRRQLAEVVRALRPTVLIGTSGQPGAFTEAVIRDMAAQARRPVVLPLSNPTSKSEATPADLVAWTDGRALLATGSPFEPVSFRGRSLRVGQANNAFVFPAIGLASIVGQVREVTRGMFVAAAERLANEVSDQELASGQLLPPVRDLRAVTARVAEEVLREVRDCGVGLSLGDDAIHKAIAEAMWVPRYVPLRPVEPAANAPARSSLLPQTA